MRAWAMAVGLLVAIASPAWAQDEAEEGSRREWYGWQLLLADTAGFAMVFSGSDDVSGGGMILLTLVNGPVIHGANGRFEHGLLSMAGRAGIPLATFAALTLSGADLFCFGEDDNDTCDTGKAETIVYTGLVAWIAFIAWDVSLGSMKLVEPDDSKELYPTLSVGGAVAPDGVSLGVFGSF